MPRFSFLQRGDGLLFPDRLNFQVRQVITSHRLSVLILRIHLRVCGVLVWGSGLIRDSITNYRLLQNLPVVSGMKLFPEDVDNYVF